VPHIVRGVSLLVRHVREKRREASRGQDRSELEGIDVIVLDIYSHSLGNRHATCYVYFLRKAMYYAILMASPTSNTSRF